MRPYLAHPDRETLEKFVRSELSPAEGLRIQRHLLLCAECEETYLDLSFDDDGPGPAERSETPDDGQEDPLDYSDAIDRVLERTRGELGRREHDFQEERRDAEERVSALLDLPAEDRLARIEREPKLRTWGACERLVEVAGRQILEDREEAVRISELAVQVARRLEPERYGNGRVHDLQARSWATLGNARRLAGDVQGAERAFGTAEGHLSRGSGDPSEEARLLEYKSSLRRSERRFDEALGLIDEAIELYRLLTERHLTGRALVRRGVILGFLDRLPESISALQAGLSLLDAASEPRIDLYGRHNLFCFLLEAGRLLEAQAMLSETRRLHRQVGEPLNMLRLHWLEGRLAAALGQMEEADEMLTDTRDGFLEAGLGLSAALVSLELAVLYVRREDLDGLKRLGDEMFPIFQERDVPREAIAELIVFQEAAQRGEVTEDLIDRVTASVRGGLVRPAALLQSM